MEIVKIVIIGIISIFLIFIVKQQRPEYAFLTSLVAGIVILSIVISKLSQIIELINVFATKAGINTNFVSIILKITGIAYLTEFGADICRDSGEQAIANKIELGGKVAIVIISIPVMMMLMELLIQILP